MEEIFNKVKKIHLVGIGGSGMSSIAEVLLNLGYQVSGSDIKNSVVIDRLKKLGAKVFIGHKATNVDDVDVVVYSAAIKDNNPEILVAKKKNIPVIPRIEMLVEIARMKYTISICGTHGKTTTTSMVGLLLQQCGYDPTIVVGGILKNIGSSAKIGKGKFIVVEADESDGSFLHLSPYIVVCTNIDNDHLDNYGSMNNLKQAFLQHFNSVPFYGFSILCGDDKRICSLLPNIKRKYYTYGIKSENNDFIAKNIELKPNFSRFVVYKNDKLVGKVLLNTTGMHNVLNALATISLGIVCGFNFSDIKSALESFDGIKRRIEFKGQIVIDDKVIDVYDDYGHHPTEIYYTLQTLRIKTNNKKIVVVFQPHRYTRTQLLYKEFPKAFSHKDKVFLAQIYPANEKPIKGVNIKLVYDEFVKNGHNVEMYNFDRLVNYLKNLAEDSVVLTLGAGDVYKIADRLIERYGK